MTVYIDRVTGAQAYAMIYSPYLSPLSDTSQEIMRRTMCNSTEVWLGTNDDEIACVWGLIPPTLLSDRAYLWLFTTDALQSHEFLLVRHSQRVMAELLCQYPVIVGHAALANPKAIRWLRWLGATFGDHQGELIPFEIRAA